VIPACCRDVDRDNAVFTLGAVRSGVKIQRPECKFYSKSRDDMAPKDNTVAVHPIEKSSGASFQAVPGPRQC